MSGKNTDNNVVTTIVHFNGSDTTIDESIIFMCDYPIWVYLFDTMLLKELRVELCQSINIGSQ